MKHKRLEYIRDRWLKVSTIIEVLYTINTVIIHLVDRIHRGYYWCRERPDNKYLIKTMQGEGSIYKST